MDQSSNLENDVRLAANLYQNDQLQGAKHKYLDAASLAIQLSKKSDEIEQLAYQNIARQLVREARDIQNEILIQQSPLPRVPDGSGKIRIKSSPTTPVNLFYFLTVTNSGTPILSYDLAELKQETKIKLNDMLLSGAITAVNQLIMELLSKPVTSINFEDGVLFIKSFNNQNFYLVFFADRDTKEFKEKLNDFCQIYCIKFQSRLESAVNTGKMLNDDAEIKLFLKKSFVN